MRADAVAPFFERHLAADEIVRLDTGRALVDRGDPRIAQVLRRAGLFDEAHAAVDLHPDRGNLDGLLGAPAFDDRREEIDERLVAFFLRGIGMTSRLVQRRGCDIGERAHRFGLRLHA